MMARASAARVPVCGNGIRSTSEGRSSGTVEQLLRLKGGELALLDEQASQMLAVAGSLCRRERRPNGLQVVGGQESCRYDRLTKLVDRNRRHGVASEWVTMSKG